MAVNQLLVKSYGTTVYITGMNTLANIAVNRPEYVEPVKQQAAKTYYIDDIDRALQLGYIAPLEHAETLAYKVPEDPQYRLNSFISEPSA